MFFPTLFLKLCVALSCGILLADVLPPAFVPAAAAGSSGLLLLWCAYRWKASAWFGVLLCFMLLLAGALAAGLGRAAPCDSAWRWPVEQALADRISYAGCICAEPVGKPRSVRLKVRLYGVAAGDTLLTSALNEQVLLYVARDSAALALRQGDLMVWRAAMEPVGFVRDGFDYAAYMRRQGVFRNAFVPAGAWRLAASGCLPPLSQVPADCRYRLLELLRRFRLKEPNHAVVAALTLGYREGLDAEMREAYASAGAMHILAVSGLHVGVLYALCHALLAPLRRRPRGRAAAAGLLLAFLWAVALVTGFSPSVTRAVTMCSFFELGTEMKRRTIAWDAVFVSAFLLLCCRPLWLFETGFRLSYGAVAAILWLSPGLLSLWTPARAWQRWPWQMICVSFAAQAGVLPFSLYAFHQFPTFFLLANFVAIPCATAILYLTLCLLPLAAAGWLPVWGGKALDAVASLLNASVRLIEQLPYATLRAIAFSETDLFFTAAVTVCFVLGVMRRRFSWLGIALALCIVWNALAMRG